jgi:hypothetical protein
MLGAAGLNISVAGAKRWMGAPSADDNNIGFGAIELRCQENSVFQAATLSIAHLRLRLD